MHLSSRAPLEKWYQDVGKLPAVEGQFTLRPHWRMDYAKVCRQYAEVVGGVR